MSRAYTLILSCLSLKLFSEHIRSCAQAGAALSRSGLSIVYVGEFVGLGVG